MTITLPRPARLDRGPHRRGRLRDYGDLVEAVRSRLATGIAERESVAEDDLAWARPPVDGALADIERGTFAIAADTDAYIDALFRPTDA